MGRAEFTEGQEGMRGKSKVKVAETRASISERPWRLDVKGQVTRRISVAENTAAGQKKEGLR
jgi:hypothetical protein